MNNRLCWLLQLLVLCATSSFLALTALAQNCAGNSVRLIVPFPPGGGADTLARVIAPRFSDLDGSQVVVDNRAGAAGNLGTDLAAKALPNGCTLLLGHSSPLVVNPSLYRELPYNTQKDFSPILLMGSSQYLLVANPTLQARTVRELVTLIKKSSPGQYSYSSAGPGSPNHLSGEVFGSMAGINLIHVPFKGGSPAMLAVLSGEVTLLFGDLAAGVPQVKAGKLIAFAVTGPARSPAIPDIPTMQEGGFPGFDVRAWMGVLAPAGVPRASVNRLNANLLKVRTLPAVQDEFKKSGMDPSDKNTPEEFAIYIRDQLDFWSKAIKNAGIKPE